MRIILVSTAGAGHVGPLLPVAAALARRGDEVTFVVPPTAATLLEGQGFRVVTGAAPADEELQPLWRSSALASEKAASAIVERQIFAIRCTKAMLPSVSEVVREWGPDLVVREPCEYASGVTAFRHQIPLVTVAISFAATEWRVLDLVADILDGHGPGLRQFLGAAPFLTRLPESLDPSPFSLTQRYRELPMAADAATPACPPVVGSRPLVYVTFGSLVGALPEAARLFRMVLEAADGLDARILFSVGREFEISSLGVLPANVVVAPWVAQEEVLAHCDAVLCHGGSGTTFGALAHGVPVGFVPLFADQPANAHAVAGAGAGIVAEGVGAESVSSRVAQVCAPGLRAMVEALLGERTYRDAARRLGDELAAQPGVDDAVARLAGWAADTNGLPGGGH